MLRVQMSAGQQLFGPPIDNFRDTVNLPGTNAAFSQPHPDNVFTSAISAQHRRHVLSSAPSQSSSSPASSHLQQALLAQSAEPVLSPLPNSTTPAAPPAHPPINMPGFGTQQRPSYGILGSPSSGYANQASPPSGPGTYGGSPSAGERRQC